MHPSTAGIFAIALTALGLSYLLRARAWAVIYVECDMHPARFIPTGLLMISAGLYLAITVNDWSSTWPIFMTAFGWLMAIEGTLLTLKPSLAGAFSEMLGARLVMFIRLGGVLVFGLGCLMSWEFLMKDYL